MKKTLLLTLSVFAASAVSASANTCTSDPLSIYDAPGFSCTLGDLTLSDFVYTPVSFGGAVVPADTTIDVTPITSSTGDGLDVTATVPWTVDPGQLDQSSLTYDVSTSNPGGLTDLYLALAGGFTGNGSASVTEDTGSAGLFTDYSSGINIPNDSATFSPVGTLSVKNGINLVGGSGGSGAEVSGFLNLFSEGSTATTPEPPLSLLCLGALAFVPLARRKFVR
jgi:hypothetical protein